MDEATNISRESRSSRGISRPRVLFRFSGRPRCAVRASSAVGCPWSNRPTAYDSTVASRPLALARSATSSPGAGSKTSTHLAISKNPKRIYYMSMEFLIGRSLTNNVMNLMLQPFISRGHRARGQPGLARPGRAGARCRARQWRPRTAGRVLPRFDGDHAAPGDGLRAALRVWHVSSVNQRGWQREHPDNWLRRQDPWEVSRRSSSSRSRSAAPSRCIRVTCRSSPIAHRP